MMYEIKIHCKRVICYYDEAALTSLQGGFNVFKILSIKAQHLAYFYQSNIAYCNDKMISHLLKKVC